MQLTQMVTGTLDQGAITNIVYEVRYEPASYSLRTRQKLIMLSSVIMVKDSIYRKVSSWSRILRLE